MSEINDLVQTFRSILKDPLDVESNLGPVSNYKIPKGFIKEVFNTYMVVDGEEYFALDYNDKDYTTKLVTGKCPGVYNGVYNQNRAYLSSEVIRTNYLLVKLAFICKQYVGIPEKFIFLARNVPTRYYKADWSLTGAAGDPPPEFVKRDYPYTVNMVEDRKLVVTFGGDHMKDLNSLKKTVDETMEASLEANKKMLALATELKGSYEHIASKVMDRVAVSEDKMNENIKTMEMQLQAQSEMLKEAHTGRVAMVDEFVSKLNDLTFYFKQAIGMTKDLADLKMDEMKHAFSDALEGKFSDEKKEEESTDGFPGKPAFGLGSAPNYYAKAQDDLNAMKDTWDQAFGSKYAEDNKPKEVEIKAIAPKPSMGVPVTIGAPMKMPKFKPKSTTPEVPIAKKSFKKKGGGL